MHLGLHGKATAWSGASRQRKFSKPAPRPVKVYVPPVKVRPVVARPPAPQPVMVKPIPVRTVKPQPQFIRAQLPEVRPTPVEQKPEVVVIKEKTNYIPIILAAGAALLALKG